MIQKRKELMAKILLTVLEKYAYRKANTYCRGRFYEPEIPRKFKKKNDDIFTG